MSSLFDHPSFWRIDPVNAFAAFVLSSDFLALSKRKPKQVDENGLPIPPAPLRASSAKVYLAMFGKFIDWLSTQHKTIFDVSSIEVMAFLEQRAEDGKRARNSVIRFQYLSLLERVYSYLHVVPNPAQHAMFDVFRSGDKGGLGTNAARAVLTAAQQVAFIQALPMPAAGRSAAQGWKRRRDRAMLAMMLGAGLKVSEVISIHTAHVGERDSTGSIPITISPGTAGGTVRWHHTQLRPFAVMEVLNWLAERRTLQIPGPLLFPASLQGKQLNKATVYRQAKATYERAGISVTRLGGRTLRNSFAINELQAGGSIELVGEFLGHRKRRSTEMYAVDAATEKSFSRCK